MKTRIGDVKMHYEISGNENAQWLVMVNGIKGMEKCSRSQMREFNKHFKVLSVDFSGRNSNSETFDSNKYSKIVAADLTRLLMDKLSIKNACFAGLPENTEIQQYFSDMFPKMVLPNINAAPDAKPSYLQDIINGFAQRVLVRILAKNTTAEMLEGLKIA